MNKYKKLIINAITAVVFGTPVIAPVMADNGFFVAPGKVDFDISRPKTQTFVVTNTGDDRIRLSVEPIYIAIDDKTFKAGTRLKEGIDKIEDISSKIRVSPRTLSLKPGQRRDLRVRINPGNLPEGDYRAYLLIKMKEAARIITSNSSKSTNDREMGMNMAIKMESAVSITAHKGERNPAASVSCSKNGVKVKNDTIWRFDGYLDNGKALRKMNVLRESVREFKNWSGNVRLMDGDKKLLMAVNCK